MGCTASKLDDLPAVGLCRDRCSFLDQAIHHRYAFAEAHVAYLHSLKHVGLSLHHFFLFHHDFNNSSAGPVLPNPSKAKADPDASVSSPTTHSNSGSHLHFHSDSEDESLHHHSDNISPINHETLALYGAGFMNINYSMKNKMTSSVSYEQRPMSSDTLHMEESSSSSSSSYYSYSNHNQNPTTSSYYSYYGGVGSGSGSGMSSFFGSPPPPPPTDGSPVGALASSSSSKPPPSPPRASSWELLNPFESFDNYYPSYTPSRNLKEMREVEGIPELEDEDYHQEIVKQVYEEDQKKFMDGGAGNAKNYAKSVAVDEKNVSQTRPSVSVDNDNDNVVVDKKVVDNIMDKSTVAALGVGLQGDSEVVKEIQVQFERASDSGNEFANMLEVGKLPYHRKNAVYQVSSKMLHVITPPLSVVVSSHPPKSAESPSSILKADPAFLDVDEDVATRSKTLSSTLQKLYIWEKKLYEEVKVEEKMRVLHERKSKKLKHLDERGAEAHKVDSTRTLVRSLSTKIRIAIQVVDKISVKINKLRDEELWPQLNQFIQGLTRMWKSMVECHRSQCQAIGEARRLDATASRKHFSDAQLEATLQLEHELLNWTLRFSCWVGAQKGYVRALNNWLLRCLLYVPEETPDGVVPFSPGRIGAPPVFVICNQWSQALESISEKEVVDSMRDFAMSVLQLWERDKLEMCQRMMANKDMERKVKNLEREDQKIQKEFQALDKQLVLVSGDGNGLAVAGHVVYQSETSKSGSLQGSLLRIFEAMERFTANSLKAYGELMQRIEEDGLAGEQEKVS